MVEKFAPVFVDAVLAGFAILTVDASLRFISVIRSGIRLKSSGYLVYLNVKESIIQRSFASMISLSKILMYRCHRLLMLLSIL